MFVCSAGPLLLTSIPLPLHTCTRRSLWRYHWRYHWRTYQLTYQLTYYPPTHRSCSYPELHAEISLTLTNPNPNPNRSYSYPELHVEISQLNGRLELQRANMQVQQNTAPQS